PGAPAHPRRPPLTARPTAACRLSLLLHQGRQQLRHPLLQFGQTAPQPAQLLALVLLRRARHPHRPRPPVAALQLRHQLHAAAARPEARAARAPPRPPVTCPPPACRVNARPRSRGARSSASALAPPGASAACFPPRLSLGLASRRWRRRRRRAPSRAAAAGAAGRSPWSPWRRCWRRTRSSRRKRGPCWGAATTSAAATPRNFRCDCGNSKFKNLQCKLLPEKGKVNSGNKYNDNFYGLYCTCKRPYPDPEDEIPDEMIQCIVCEDWFHGRHLGAVPPESGDFHEMVCQACMNRCHFLWAYASQLAVPALTKVNSREDEGIVLKVEESEEQKKEIKKESGAEREETKEEKQTEQFNEPSTSSGSACTEVVTKSEEPVCKLKELQSKQFLKKDTATFWPSNWRSKLCTCEDCLKMYSELEVQFLTDECDTVLAYENKGTSDQETERRDPLMDTLNSMNRVQQVELICEYNDLKTELTDYLRRFADEGTVRCNLQNSFARKYVLKYC
uniref:Putative E3 ubiquitin-protein ligase UBR7 n=1 Tax=Falco tinnunculus TaxID=100819 RepID=A0A8C4XSH9_FALTI